MKTQKTDEGNRKHTIAQMMNFLGFHRHVRMLMLIRAYYILYPSSMLLVLPTEIFKKKKKAEILQEQEIRRFPEIYISSRR